MALTAWDWLGQASGSRYRLNSRCRLENMPTLGGSKLLRSSNSARWSWWASIGLNHVCALWKWWDRRNNSDEARDGVEESRCGFVRGRRVMTSPDLPCRVVDGDLGRTRDDERREEQLWWYSGPSIECRGAQWCGATFVEANWRWICGQWGCNRVS